MSGQIRLPDFDVLVSMYRHEPEAFEAFRRHVLRQAVEQAPAHHRPSLEQLLERIEEARTSAETPYDAAAGAMQMMQDSVGRLHDAWEEARTAVAGLHAAIIIERVRAEHRSF